MHQAASLARRGGMRPELGELGLEAGMGGNMDIGGERHLGFK
ncbi:hypothetical protein GCM10025794_32120 [Massilia kyonggiensis]